MGPASVVASACLHLFPFHLLRNLCAVSKDNRPVNLDLDITSLPITALASITHRVAGVALFIATALLLWALDVSLSSEEGFETLKGLILSPIGRFVAWGLLAAVAYHFVAGLKHLLLDLEIADTAEGGFVASIIVLLCSGVLLALAGLWIFTL